MIPARKSAPFNFVLRRWLDRTLRRRFHIVSHRFLAHDIHLAMEEKNLRRYRFFTWMGAYGLDLANRGSALAGMRYAVRLLRGRTPAGRAPLAWMFVQGKLLPAGPVIEVKPGAAFLARQTGACVLPVVLRYEWLKESRPSIFVQIGAPMDASASPEEIGTALNALFIRVGETLDPLDLRGFIPLYQARFSMNERWDRWVRWFGRKRAATDVSNG